MNYVWIIEYRRNNDDKWTIYDFFGYVNRQSAEARIDQLRSSWVGGELRASKYQRVEGE